MTKLKALACLFALIFLAGATTPNSFVTPQVPSRGIVRFVQGTDAPSVLKTIYSAGANGSRCYAMWMTSNDTVSHGVLVSFVNSSNQFGGISVNTGTTTPGYVNGSPPINLMASTVWVGLPVDQYGNPYIQLNSGDSLQALYVTALTASTQINIIASCADY